MGQQPPQNPGPASGQPSPHNQPPGQPTGPYYQPTPPPGAPYAAPPPPQKQKRGWVKWVVIAVVVLLVGGCINALTRGGSSGQSSTGAAGTNASSTSSKTAPPSSNAPASSSKPAADPKAIFDTKYGKFEPQTISGNGPKVIPLPDAKAGLVEADHQGGANFIVSGLDVNNQASGELLVNTIGTYHGTTAWGFSGLGKSKSLQVEASGPWTITISPVSSAPVLEVPTEGTGDAVHIYTGGAASWNFTHNGSANFIVAEHGSSVIPLLINEIGNFEGQKAITPGPAVFTINADGDWTIKP